MDAEPVGCVQPEPVRRNIMPVARGGLVVYLLAVEWPRYVPLRVLAERCGVSEHYMQQRFMTKFEGAEYSVPIQWSKDGHAVRLNPERVLRIREQ